MVFHLCRCRFLCESGEHILLVFASHYLDKLLKFTFAPVLHWSGLRITLVFVILRHADINLLFILELLRVRLLSLLHPLAFILLHLLTDCLDVKRWNQREDQCISLGINFIVLFFVMFCFIGR